MEVRPNPEGGNSKVKVKGRVNPNGIFNVSNASMIEKHEVHESCIDDNQYFGPFDAYSSM